MLETRLSEYLDAKEAAVPQRSGNLETVMRRGRRRSLVTRATYGLAAAAAVVAVIAGTALFVGGDGAPEPDLVPPAAGGETEVIPGTPAPTPEVTPPGTEVPFGDLGTITDADRLLLAEYLGDRDSVVYGIGEVGDGTRVFLVTGRVNDAGEPESCLVGGLGNAAGEFICMPGGPAGSFPGLNLGERGGVVYGLVPEGAAYVVATSAAGVVWQQAVERAIWLPYGGASASIEMYDASGRLMMSRSLDTGEERARQQAMEELVAKWTAERARDEMISQAAITWVNTTGLNRTDVEVWRTRLARACTEGVWEPEVARSLAAEFIETDLDVSIRGEGAVAPDLDDVAMSLWIMARPLCPDAFPDGSTPVGAGG